MNANELADYVDKREINNPHLKEVATMLRQFGLAESIIKQQQIEIEELKATMRSFFEDFLNVREESDSGRVFAPITISSCRCMMTEPLSNLLDKMRKLSGAKPPPQTRGLR